MRGHDVIGEGDVCPPQAKADEFCDLAPKPE